MQTTLMIAKPDSVRLGYVGSLLRMLERDGFRVADSKALTFSAQLTDALYAEHRGKDFYPNLAAFMQSGTSVVFRLERKDAVARLREKIGTGAPDEGASTLRGRYASSITENAVHGSDSVLAARREVPLFFPGAPLVGL